MRGAPRHSTPTQAKTTLNRSLQPKPLLLPRQHGTPGHVVVTPLWQGSNRSTRPSHQAPAAYQAAHYGGAPSSWTGAGYYRSSVVLPSYDDTAGSDSSGDDGSPLQQHRASDPLTSAWEAVSGVAAALVGFLVARLTDVMLVLAPPQTPRHAAENCVKTGMALTGLALLQSIASFVLSLGCCVLALYAATQVYGVPVPFISSGSDGQPRGRTRRPAAAAAGSRGFNGALGGGGGGGPNAQQGPGPMSYREAPPAGATAARGSSNSAAAAMPPPLQQQPLGAVDPRAMEWQQPAYRSAARRQRWPQPLPRQPVATQAGPRVQYGPIIDAL